MKNRDERQRPALGDERRAEHGVLGATNHPRNLQQRPPLRTALVVAGVSLVTVLAVLITARSFEDDPSSPRNAAVAPATETPAEPITSATPAPEPTSPPTPASTQAPLEPDPTVVSEGLLTFVAPDGSLRIVSASGEEEIIAEDVLHPSVHPDRDAVAYVRYDGLTSEIWIWEANGAAELLGSRDGLVRNLEWSEGGDALLYHVQDGGETTTIIRRYDFVWGAADTLLASDEFSLEDASIGGFDVFPNGDLAVQVNEGGASCDIYLVDSGFRYAEALTDREDGACYGHPSVSPDGEQIAFIVQLADGAAQVAVVDADGDDYRELAGITAAAATEDDFWPRIAWSPDSELVLYEALDGEAVYAQDASDTSGETRRLVAYGHHPAWQ